LFCRDAIPRVLTKIDAKYCVSTKNPPMSKVQRPASNCLQVPHTIVSLRYI
jgi:hypothetical protein